MGRMTAYGGTSERILSVSQPSAVIFPMKSALSRRTLLPGASNRVEKGLGSEEEELAEVVEACKKGDPEAQLRLYEATFQNVYRLVVRMVGMQEADDVTQQVFLQAFRKIGQFSGRSRFGTWIHRVAVNESLQHLRKSKRVRMQILEQDTVDRSPAEHANIEDKELLEQALTRLEPELRATFLLREIDGFSYEAIAEALGIPIGTVGSRMNRARRELKSYLVELGWEP